MATFKMDYLSNFKICITVLLMMWLSWWLSSKDLPATTGEFNLWVGKISWKSAWQPTPVFLPGNPMNRGAWQATVRWGTKGQIRLSNWAWTSTINYSGHAICYIPRAHLLYKWKFVPFDPLYLLCGPWQQSQVSSLYLWAWGGFLVCFLDSTYKYI